MSAPEATSFEPLPGIPNDRRHIDAMAADPEIDRLRRRLLSKMAEYRYAYNWTWWGRPVIQLPSDIMAMQMLIMHCRPDLIIETGIAHGGSLILYASLMELAGRGEVIGVDIDIRDHNRTAIEAHPMSRRISLIEGSSTDPAIVSRVSQRAAQADCVLVCLDSNHTAEHVAAELEMYSPLVTPGAYLVVFDTVIEQMPGEDFPDRSWGPGNSPMTAVHEFLDRHAEFKIDRQLESRLMFSAAPSGYLRRIG